MIKAFLEDGVEDYELRSVNLFFILRRREGRQDALLYIVLPCTWMNLEPNSLGSLFEFH
jgi:hypothetical protein